MPAIANLGNILPKFFEGFFTISSNLVVLNRMPPRESWRLEI